MLLKFGFIFFIKYVLSNVQVRTMNTILLSPFEWNCMMFQTLTQAAIQVYTETGEIIQVGIENMKNLQMGLDAVYTPCLKDCKNSRNTAKDQISDLMTALAIGLPGRPYGLEGLCVWIDIDESLPWSNDKSKNQAFIMEAIETIFSYNFTEVAGVIANATTWSKVFGSSFTKPAHYHREIFLWWRYWNGQPGLAGWTPFGGWDEFEAHEFVGGLSNDSCAPGAKFAYGGTNLPNNLIHTETVERKAESNVNANTSSYDEDFARNVLYPLSISVMADNSYECVSSYFGSNITIIDVANVTCLPFITDTCKAMMAVDDLNKMFFLIFRGTTSTGIQFFNELLNLELVPYKNIGNVVKYFADAFDTLWTVGELEGKFQQANLHYTNYSLIISGHSLGGSLSSIAAAFITKNNLATEFKSVSLITMGEPRTGDLDFANALDSRVDASIRIVHGLDPIPHFPKRDPLLPLLTYAHHGAEYWYSLGMYNGVDYYFCPTSENQSVIFNCSDRLEPTDIYYNLIYSDVVAPYHVTYWQKDITKSAANNCQNIY